MEKKMTQIQNLPLSGGKHLLWGVSLLSLCLTSACSDDNNDDANVTKPDEAEEQIAPQLTTSTLTIENDAALLAARVVNYSNGLNTRASDDFIMPAEPSVPEDAVSSVGLQTNWSVAQNNVYVPAGTEWTPNPMVSGTYYVAGTLNLTTTWTNYYLTDQTTIYVLSGGKLYLGQSISSRVHIYVYGSFEVASNVSNLLNNYDQSETCGLYCVGDLDLSGRDIQGNGGTLYVGGSLNVGSLTSGNNRHGLTLGCGSVIGGSLNLSGNSCLNVLGGLTVAGNIILSSGSYIYLSSGSLLKAKELQMNNTENQVISEGPGYAYLDLESLASNTLDLTEKLNGPIGIKCAKFIQNWQEFPDSLFTFLPQVKVNAEMEENGLSLPTGCPSVGGTTDPSQPDPDPEPDPVLIPTLVTIARVDTAAHTHDISSTCITEHNGKVYVSWHQRGNDYHGCVEVGTVTDDKCVLNQYFETVATSGNGTVNGEYGKDFNHIYIDTQAQPNRVVAVGNEYKGGVLAYAYLGSDGLVAAGQDTLYTRRLWGGDGNCIVRVGDYYQVATTYGYEIYSVTDFKRVQRDSLPGKAKFIVNDGSRFVGLHYDTREERFDPTTVAIADEENGNAYLSYNTFSLDQFGARDYLLEGMGEGLSHSHTLQSGVTIGPVNGKNAMAVDGETIYVCRGAYGLSRYGALTGDFVLPRTASNTPRGYANGVCVDGDYVYVAYGSAGVYVLNKSDLSVVTKYVHTGGKSANYVLAKNGKIYVAYGRNGWEVLTLQWISSR
jgi:hypothetical protein